VAKADGLSLLVSEAQLLPQVSLDHLSPHSQLCLLHEHSLDIRSLEWACGILKELPDHYLRPHMYLLELEGSLCGCQTFLILV